MPTLTHGTLGGYSNHKCRCGACSTAFREYMQVYRAMKKARGLCHWCTAPVVEGRTACQRHLDQHKAQQAGYRHHVRSQRKRETPCETTL